MRDDQWQQAFDAGRAEAAAEVETVACALEALLAWPLSGPEPSRLWDEVRDALAKYREGR